MYIYCIHGIKMYSDMFCLKCPLKISLGLTHSEVFLTDHSCKGMMN